MVSFDFLDKSMEASKCLNISGKYSRCGYDGEDRKMIKHTI